MGKKAKLFVFGGISFLVGASIIGSVAAYASINKKNEIRVSEYNKFLEEKTNLNSFDNWENDKKISSIKSNTLSEVEKIDKNSDLFTIQKARKIVNESIENIKNIIASHKKMLLEKEKAFIQYNNVKKQLQDMLLKIFDFLNKESQEHYYIGDGNEKIINKQNWLLKEINENQKYFSNITIDSDIDSIELATTKLIEIKFLINDKQEAYKFAKEYNDLLKEIKQFISDWYELLKDPDIKKTRRSLWLQHARNFIRIFFI